MENVISFRQLTFTESFIFMHGHDGRVQLFLAVSTAEAGFVKRLENKGAGV